MWMDRHRTRHERRLNDMVLQAGLDEVTRFVERADPPGSPGAMPARRVLAAIAGHNGVDGPCYRHCCAKLRSLICQSQDLIRQTVSD